MSGMAFMAAWSVVSGPCQLVETVGCIQLTTSNCHGPCNRKPPPEFIVRYEPTKKAPSDLFGPRGLDSLWIATALLAAYLRRPLGREGKAKPPKIADRPLHVSYYACRRKLCKCGIPVLSRLLILRGWRKNSRKNRRSAGCRTIRVAPRVVILNHLNRIDFLCQNGHAVLRAGCRTSRIRWWHRIHRITERQGGAVPDAALLLQTRTQSSIDLDEEACILQHEKSPHGL